MEVTKRSSLLLDGAGDNSVLLFSLVRTGWNRLSQTGWNWNRFSETSRIDRRLDMEWNHLSETGWIFLSVRDGIACQY